MRLAAHQIHNGPRESMQTFHVTVNPSKGSIISEKIHAIHITQQRQLPKEAHPAGRRAAGSRLLTQVHNSSPAWLWFQRRRPAGFVINNSDWDSFDGPFDGWMDRDKQYSPENNSTVHCTPGWSLVRIWLTARYMWFNGRFGRIVMLQPVCVCKHRAIRSLTDWLWYCVFFGWNIHENGISSRMLIFAFYTMRSCINFQSQPSANGC